MMRTQVEMSIQSQNQHFFTSWIVVQKIQLAMPAYCRRALICCRYQYYSVGLLKFLIGRRFMIKAWILNKSLVIGLSVLLFVGVFGFAHETHFQAFLLAWKSKEERVNKCEQGNIFSIYAKIKAIYPFRRGLYYSVQARRSHSNYKLCNYAVLFDNSSPEVSK